jgi:hypothetical protein
MRTRTIVSPRATDGAGSRSESIMMVPFSSRTALALLGLAGLLLLPAGAAAQAAAASQAKSGPMAVDACAVLTAAELEQALGHKVKPQRVPPNTPTSAGVSVCMYASPTGRQTLSVTTHAPEAVVRTHAGTLQGYYDSIKTSNANLTGKPPQVLPGAGRHATYFMNPRDSGDVILVLRRDCVVTINISSLKGRDEALAIAKAAGS